MAIRGELTENYQHGNGDGMLQSQRRAHSRAATEDALQRYCDDAGKTLRDVARRVGRTHAYLSRCRHGIAPIRRAIAEMVRVETVSERHPNGFAVSKANWPGGFID